MAVDVTKILTEQPPCPRCQGEGRFFTTAASSSRGHSHWDDCPDCGGTGTAAYGVPNPVPPNDPGRDA